MLATSQGAPPEYGTLKGLDMVSSWTSPTAARLVNAAVVICLPGDSVHAQSANCLCVLQKAWLLATGGARHEGWRPAETDCAPQPGTMLTTSVPVAHSMYQRNRPSRLCTGTPSHMSYTGLLSSDKAGIGV